MSAILLPRSISAFAVEDSDCQQKQMLMLGVGPLVIPAGGKVHCFLYPQIPFQTQRVIVPGNLAEHFMVNGIYANLQKELAAPVPALVFAEASFGVSMRFNTVFPGEWLLIQLENISQQDLQFLASFMGVSGEHDGRMTPRREPPKKGDIRIECRLGEVYQGKERGYHGWLINRAKVYEELFFPGDDTSILGLDPSRFVPTKGRWWVAANGKMVRAEDALEEDFELGRKIAGLTLVNPHTYEGF